MQMVHERGGLRPIKRTHWKPLKKQRDLIPIIPKNPFKKHATLFVSLSKTQCNLVINYSLKSLQKTQRDLVINYSQNLLKTQYDMIYQSIL
jgi:hypothetical protein